MKKYVSEFCTKALLPGLLCLTLYAIPVQAGKPAPDDSISTSPTGIAYQKGTETSNYTHIEIQFPVKEFIKNCIPATPNERISEVCDSCDSLFKASPRDLLEQIALVHQDQWGENQLGTTFAGFQTITSATTDSQVVTLLKSELGKKLQKSKDLLARRLAAMENLLPFYLIQEDRLHLGRIKVRTSSSKGFSNIARLVSTPGELQIWTTYPVKDIPEKLLKQIRSDLKRQSKGEKPWGIIGYAEPRKKNKINEIIRENKALIPDDLHFAWAARKESLDAKKAPTYTLYALKKHEGGPSIAGHSVEAASSVGMSEKGIVVVKFTPAATKAFSALTASHLNQPIAIALDDEVLTMPYVQAKIDSGNVQILYNIDPFEAAITAAILNQPPFELVPQIKKINLVYGTSPHVQSTPNRTSTSARD